MRGVTNWGEVVKRLIWLGLVALCCASLAPAQTISPVIVEYPEKADGRFQIYNDADVPLTVVLEPHSFSVNEAGNATFRKLDPGIHVQLSSTSFRLAPKQTFFVFYKASAETLPNWFCIYATITGATTTTGIKLALELPHTVYLLSRKPLNRDEVSWGRTEVVGAGYKQKIAAEVENHGAGFTRVEEIQVTSASGKQEFGGFPLFPGQRRAFELEWNQPGTPAHITLKCSHFKLESDLKTTTAELKSATPSP
jgi:hypothetical protein